MIPRWQVISGVCLQPDTVHPFFGIATEIRLQFVFAYDPAEFAESLRAIAEGDIRPRASDHERGGSQAGRRRVSTTWPTPTGHCKILVTP